MKICGTFEALPDRVLVMLDREDEKGAAAVSAREDTNSIWIEEDSGKVIGYAIFGKDKGDMLAVYYARSFVPVLGPMLMKQFFGVAQVMGVPLRMHIQDLRDLKVKARMFGAETSIEGSDADGILQGVWF